MELYIEGHKIELTSDAIRQTIQVNDIAELKDRQSNFTNRFKIPKTPGNVEVMDMLGIPGNISDKPYKKLQAKLVDDGIEIVSNGYALIQSTNSDYNCVIYDGNIELTEILKGKKLNELDYSDLNHTLNVETFLNSLDNTTGYIHAFADYGRMKGNKFVVEYNPGALFISTLWDKIFTGAGLSFSGNIFSNKKFLNTVVTPIKGYEVNNAPDVIADLGIIGTNVILQHKTIDIDDVYTEEYFTFIGTANQLINNTTNLEFNYDGLCKINIGASISVTGGTANIIIELNGVSIATIEEENLQKTIILIVNSGDKLKMKLTAVGKRHDVSGGDNDYLDVSANATLNLYEIEINNSIDYSAIMPETLQTDFIKDIMQRFGLMFRKRKNSAHFEFIEMEELLNDKNNIEDWSKKYLSSTESYKVGSYAKNNYMVYKYDDDTSKFANGNLQVAIELLPSEKNLFTSIFNASIYGTKINNVPAYQIPLWEQDKDDDGNEIYKPADTNIRIFEIVRRQMSVYIGIETSNNTIVVSASNGIPFLDFMPCYYSEYVDLFYRTFKKLLDKSKKISAQIWLDPVDVYQLDFFKLKYIEQLGAYFYLNKIANFIKGKPAKVELIETGGFYYNSPPTVVGNNQKSINHGETYTFSWNDFTTDTTPPYYDPDGDPATDIKITSLFDRAELKLNGVAISINDEIQKSDVDAGLLQATVNGSVKELFYTDMKFKLKSSGCDFYSVVEGTFTLEVQAAIPQPPVVDAGPDKLVFLPDNSVTLNGTASDDDGIASILWSKVSGGIASIISPTDLTTDIDNLELGDYLFKLTATDNNGNSASDTVIVKHWTRYTAISRDDPQPEPNTNYTVTIMGEPFAQITMLITTDDHASADVEGVNVSSNGTKTFSINLDDTGQIDMDVEVSAETGYVGTMTLKITAISKGILGNDTVTCTADAS